MLQGGAMLVACELLKQAAAQEAQKPAAAAAAAAAATAAAAAQSRKASAAAAAAAAADGEGSSTRKKFVIPSFPSPGGDDDEEEDEVGSVPRPVRRGRAFTMKLVGGSMKMSSASCSLAGSSVAAADWLPEDGSRWLKLDHNPLGASSMKLLLWTVADTRVGDHLVRSTGSSSSNSASFSSEAWAEDPAVIGGLRLTVHGCSLLQRAKGLRSNMSDSTAAAPIRPQVPYLSDAVMQPGDEKAPPPGISKAAVKASKASVSTSAAALAAAAAAPASTILVFNETGTGWDPTAPAGRYHINVQHPAAPALFGRLLDLRTRLVELQALQQQKQAEQRLLQQQQQQQQQSRASSAVHQPSRPAAAARRSSLGDGDDLLLGGSPAGSQRGTLESVTASGSGEAPAQQRRLSSAGSQGGPGVKELRRRSSMAGDDSRQQAAVKVSPRRASLTSLLTSGGHDSCMFVHVTCHLGGFGSHVSTAEHC
jgi:hypothetical protein